MPIERGCKHAFLGRARPSQVLAGSWIVYLLKYTRSTWRAPQLKVWPGIAWGLFFFVGRAWGATSQLD